MVDYYCICDNETTIERKNWDSDLDVEERFEDLKNETMNALKQNIARY